jgi:transcriptional regulator with XRE-family HTH domain
METNKAIIKRIYELCEEHGSNVCEISLRGGMSPSALYELVNGRTQYPKVITVKKFCEGIGITLSEFFDRDYFNDRIED